VISPVWTKLAWAAGRSASAKTVPAKTDSPALLNRAAARVKAVWMLTCSWAIAALYSAPVSFVLESLPHEPGGSACRYWNRNGRPCNHPAQVVPAPRGRERALSVTTWRRSSMGSRCAGSAIAAAHREKSRPV